MGVGEMMGHIPENSRSGDRFYKKDRRALSAGYSNPATRQRQYRA
jgi:hypothetical protein